jgi:hypothetical protein
VSDERQWNPFEEFINQVLDMTGLPEPETANQEDSPPMPVSFSVSNPREDWYPGLKERIRGVWTDLHKEPIQRNYWAQYLTPLEQDSRPVLETLILEKVRKNFPANPNDHEMRSIIAYSMTISWLIMAAIIDHYAGNGDVDENGSEPEGGGVFF